MYLLLSDYYPAGERKGFIPGTCLPALRVWNNKNIINKSYFSPILSSVLSKLFLLPLGTEQYYQPKLHIIRQSITLKIFKAIFPFLLAKIANGYQFLKNCFKKFKRTRFFTNIFILVAKITYLFLRTCSFQKINFFFFLENLLKKT